MKRDLDLKVCLILRTTVLAASQMGSTAAYKGEREGLAPGIRLDTCDTCHGLLVDDSQDIFLREILLGSVSEHVILHSKNPVLIIKR